MNYINISKMLDEGTYSNVQKMVFLLAALSIIMDGFDGQLIGYAIPSLIKEWGLTRDDFSPVVATGLLGMGIGSALAGFFADKFGRRWAIIGSVITFSIATFFIGFVNGIYELTILRFIAGLGIGGALPTSTTMTAEYTPARRRTLAVTATIVCVPLGGVLAGFFASFILPTYGWRWIFFVGGSISILLAIVLYILLPESPRYLMRQPKRIEELHLLLKRMGRDVPKDSLFVDEDEDIVTIKEKKSGIGALFSEGRARDTLSIWSAFFMCLLAIYAAFSWLPTMLTSEGLSVSVASRGLTAYNLGGVFGALGCAIFVTRFGSKIPLLLCSIGGAVSAFLLMGIDITEYTGILIFGLGVHGLFTNAIQSVMYPLCAYIYPTQVRATGTAMALVLGRVGTIVSAFAGATVITYGGANAYLMLLGVAMLFVFFSLIQIKNHIPARQK